MSEPHRISLKPPAGWSFRNRTGSLFGVRKFQRSPGLENAKRVDLIVVSETPVLSWSLNGDAVECRVDSLQTPGRYQVHCTGILQPLNRFELGWNVDTFQPSSPPSFDAWLEIFS